MNKSTMLMVLLVSCASCIDKHRSDAQSATVADAVASDMAVGTMKVDTMHVDLKQSKIDWVVTEMKGARRRTGEIQFQNAYLLVNHHSILTGGRFIVDMETIDVTDIPKSESIARKNVIKHLRSESFFYVDRYPIATFEMTDVQKKEVNQLKIYGNLSIRGVTKQIVFDALSDGHLFTARFVFDRFQWNIAYEGSWVNKTLIDQDVELTIELVAK